MNTDTITAIASGLSSSGISVIRISGPEAFSIADSIFCSKSGRTVRDMKSFTVSYGHIVCRGRVIDEVLLIKMAAPKTYTREDVVEIDCHGGIVVTKVVLNAVIEAGARPADPGEFTKRAFLNGRIDLSQAEAVSDIIASKSALALKNSINQLRGDVKNRISSLRERLILKTAFIEAALDDPEHYSLDGFSDELLGEVKDIQGEIIKLIDSGDNGRIIKEGINTVILGRPNAGKSSLLNVILGSERAIVTDIAGTTRDTLEESVTLNGLILNIVDTAGIRTTANVIEQMGVDKARDAARSADVILYVIDSIVGITDEDYDILNSVSDKKVIILLNKADAVDKDDYDALSDSVRTHFADCHDIQVLCVSAKEHDGIDILEQTLMQMFFAGDIAVNDEIYITNARQKNLLVQARNSLDNVIRSINDGMPEDFFSIDLMDAYAFLGLITGDNVEDDLADKIFSEFCMGK